MKTDHNLTYHQKNPPIICATITEVPSFLANLLELRREALTGMTREQAKTLILEAKAPTNPPETTLNSTMIMTTTEKEPTMEEQVPE